MAGAGLNFVRSKPGHLVYTGTEFHAAVALNYYPIMDEDRLKPAI